VVLITKERQQQRLGEAAESAAQAAQGPRSPASAGV
jgi:hypothetical protein